jgi:hypothetical protein
MVGSWLIQLRTGVALAKIGVSARLAGASSPGETVANENIPRLVGVPTSAFTAPLRAFLTWFISVELSDSDTSTTMPMLMPHSVGAGGLMSPSAKERLKLPAGTQPGPLTSAWSAGTSATRFVVVTETCSMYGWAEPMTVPLAQVGVHSNSPSAIWSMRK